VSYPLFLTLYRRGLQLTEVFVRFWAFRGIYEITVCFLRSFFGQLEKMGVTCLDLVANPLLLGADMYTSKEPHSSGAHFWRSVTGDSSGTGRAEGRE
jgi:hypothetical protein